MVTVVDAANLLKDYSSSTFWQIAARRAGEGDVRTIVDLLVEQIEFADVVVLNKVGLASPAELDAARKIVVALNPDAASWKQTSAVSTCARCWERVVSTSTAPRNTTLVQGTARFREHVPETEEYGIRSFVYRQSSPSILSRSRRSSTGPGPALSAPRLLLAGHTPIMSERSARPARRSARARPFCWVVFHSPGRWPRNGFCRADEALSRPRLGRPPAGDRLHRLE